MQQQDSQELLRYLMDGLRNEEAKRQKQAILKYFGLTEKTDPKVVKN
jgi:ubiquitin carboxyl-terminal hydrolase 16/45